MRTVATSGGLEWDGDGSAYLDAIPLALPGVRTLAVQEVIDAATGPMRWANWRPEMSPAHNLRGFTGVIGVNETAGVILRYIWRRGAAAADGLYAIEARDMLPAAVAGAVLAAAAGQPLPEPSTYANHVPAVLARMCEIGVADPPQPERMNRAGIERVVTAHLRALADPDTTELPVPFGAVNRARFYLALAQALWQPATLAVLGRVANLASLRQCNELAVVWRELRPGATLRIGKADVRPPAVMFGSPWMEMLSWTARSIPADTARFFSSFRATDESWALLLKLPQLDARHADAVAAGLIREARARQVYAASGQFVLVLPAHLPWAQTPIRSLAIHVQENGLWVAGLTARSERTASFWWQPEMTVAALSQHTLPAQPLVHVTLAAFWHDLLVAGDEVVVAPGAQPRPASAKSAGQPPRTHGAGNPVVVLPRRTVHYSGRREWSTPADREIITRRSHGVRGHLRELPQGWSRSLDAESEAREWGFVLPDGCTFVRPHVRGGHDHDPAPVIAKARGLQTLSALI